MSYMNLDSLKRYAQKEKEWSDEKFLSENDLNWQKTEKAGAVACYPVGESPLEGTVEFKFKETLPAEGTKGPDNPSSIAGVSSVKVTRCGKNIIPQQNTSLTFYDITYSPRSDGGYSVSGTSDTVHNSYYELLNQSIDEIIKENVQYTISFPAIVNGKVTLRLRNSDVEVVVDVAQNGFSTITKDEKYGSFVFVVGRLYGSVDSIVYPQIELGSTATTFEPYSGTDYTIDLGGTYYGGSIDLKTGLMTVTHVCAELDGTYEWANNGSYNSTTGLKFFQGYAPTFFGGTIQGNDSRICSHFIRGVCTDAGVGDGSIISPVFTVVSGTQLRIAAPVSSASEFMAWLAEQKTNGTPVRITGQLTTPRIIQLTPPQILSLPLLDKCTPRVNTLYTDAESIQIGYAKHPSRTAYELQQAIIAGGNH